MREWKPGDVAMRVDARGGTSLAFCVTDCVNHAADVHWHTVKGGRADWDTLIYSGVTYRPLVVIDPEDREAVALLLSSYHSWKWTAEIAEASITDMQAVLREFANPTPAKPDEPTGLGAVVEDAAGKLWFRMAIKNQTWPGEIWQEQYGNADRWSRWESITAVRVLSTGVTS